MIYKKGEKIVCEECHETWEYPVEDYVIPDRIGIASCSEEKCCFCDAEYTVQAYRDGTFDVELS